MNGKTNQQFSPPATTGPWLGAFDSLARVITHAAGLVLFAMMMMMVIYIVGRKFGAPLPGAFEASEQLMVIIFAFPLAEVGLKKGHIIFELITRFLPPRVLARLEIFSHIFGLVLFIPLTWKSWEVAISNMVIGEYRQGIIDFPIWPFRFALAFGLTVFLMQLVISFIRTLKKRSS